MKDAEPHHSAYTGNATISLLRKESRKRADRLLLRKESEGMKDAEPHHSAYTGNATISLLRKEWKNVRISYSFGRSEGNARVGYTFRMGIRCRIRCKVRIVRSSNPLK